MSATIFAQKPMLDSIRVQIDDKMELELAIDDYENINQKLGEDLKKLQSILKESDGILEAGSYKITYKPDKSVTVKQSELNERIIWKGDEPVKYQYNNQCVINSEFYFLLIRFNDIESITSDNLIQKIEEVINTTDTLQGRWAATYNFTFQGKNLVHNQQFDKHNGQMDALIVSGGLGIDLIKSEPVIDLSALVGLQFNQKGVFKNLYYLSYNQLSYFDDEDKVNLNGFANVGYRHNFSHDQKEPNWIGMELGYLVSHHGSLFDKNTFRLGINWEVGKYISVTPQLYISKNLTYPALRIGFGF